MHACDIDVTVTRSSDTATVLGTETVFRLFNCFLGAVLEADNRPFPQRLFRLFQKNRPGITGSVISGRSFPVGYHAPYPLPPVNASVPVWNPRHVSTCTARSRSNARPRERAYAGGVVCLRSMSVIIVCARDYFA